MKKIIPFAALVAAMVLWSSTFVALKYSFRYFPPMFVIFARMFVAAICFLPMLPFIKPRKILKKDIYLIIAMSVMEPCFYFVFEAFALKNTTSSQAGMITALLPLAVAVGAAIFLSEKSSVKAYFGFFTAIVGAFILSASGIPEPESPNPVLGNFYEFLAMVCAAGYTLLLKKLSSRHNPFFLTFSQTLCGSIFFALIIWVQDVTEIQPFPEQWPLIPVLVLIYLGTFITMGAYGLYNYGVSKIPASKASVFVNLIPVFSVFWGWTVLGERFTPLQCFAGAIILVGVWISQSSSIKEYGSSSNIIEENCK